MQTTQTIQGKQRIMMQHMTASEPAASICSRTVIVPLVLFVDSLERSVSAMFEDVDEEELLLLEVLLLGGLVELVRFAVTVSLRASRRSVSSFSSVMLTSVKFMLVKFTLLEFAPEAYRCLRSVFRPLTLCLAKAMSVSVFVEMITAIDTRNATVTELKNFTMMGEIK